MTAPQLVAAALYEALNAGDFAAVLALLAPDVLGQISDLAPPHTEHRGTDALVDHLRRRRALGEGSYRIDGWSFEDHPKLDDFAVALVCHSAIFAGERVSSETMHVLRIDDDRIVLLGASLPAGQVDGRWFGLVA